MRILIHSLNFAPEPTGVGKYSGEMAEWLAEQGHEVRVVTAPPHYPGYKILDGYSGWRFSRSKPVQESDLRGSVSVFRCPLWVPREPRSWKRIAHLVSFSLSSWISMLRQIGWKPHVVIMLAPAICCAPGTLSTARLARSVAWLHVQDFEVDAAFSLMDFSSQRLRRWVLAAERRILSKFDRVSAISDRMVEKLAEKGVAAHRRILFPNWVDTSVIYPLASPSPLRSELQIPPDAIVALYSGSMGKKQGLEVLVETSRRLADRPDIRFVFCGDGSLREMMLDMTKRFSNVMSLPLQPVERLNELLNLADIHLLPQIADAADLVMPSKLTGMMASGRAVLATAAPGTQLFTAVTGRGIVTPPGDVDAFTSGLLRLANDRHLRNEMGQQGRNYAVKFLNRDEVLRRFEASLLQAGGFPSISIDTLATSGRAVTGSEDYLMTVENATSGKAGDD
jgi:colanic acid biosynthesis glycosyl transferase WcaI